MDFLSVLLVFLWKCKSRLWRKAKTDFFYKLTAIPMDGCVFSYNGCRIKRTVSPKEQESSSKRPVSRRSLMRKLSSALCT